MDPTGEQPQSVDMLSLRERECLRLVHQGMNSKEIGQALRLSPHTVDHHLRHSIRKLSSRDRRAAARALAARESDDPIVRDWLRQTLSLVSAAGLVMDELAEASTSHGPDEHHRVEHGRLPAEVEVERPALILAETLPAYQQPLMQHLLYTLKADAQGLSSEEVLSDILVAIRLATNKRMSLSHLESAANAS